MSTMRPTRFLVLEALIIALGVLAGLFAQQWQEERSARAEAELARGAIVAELTSNLEALRGSASYHQQSMGTLMGGGELDARRDFPRGFISPAAVLDASWESAKATGALQALPREQVEVAARIYARQDDYVRQVGQIAPMLYRSIFEQGTQSILDRPQNLSQVIGMLWFRETGLIEATEAAVQSLGG